jgi:hypothetical protein
MPSEAINKKLQIFIEKLDEQIAVCRQMGDKAWEDGKKQKSENYHSDARELTEHKKRLLFLTSLEIGDKVSNQQGSEGIVTKILYPQSSQDVHDIVEVLITKSNSSLNLEGFHERFRSKELKKI